MTPTQDQVHTERRIQRLIVLMMIIGFFLLSFMQRNERSVLLMPVPQAPSAFVAITSAEQLDPILANGFFDSGKVRFVRTVKLGSIASSPLPQPAFERDSSRAGLFVADLDTPLGYAYDYSPPGVEALSDPIGPPGARDQAPEAGVSAAVGAVPEPSSWLSLIIGIGGLGCLLRYQRRRQRVSIAVAG